MIKVSGVRSDLTDFWSISGIFDYKEHPHNQYIVITSREGSDAEIGIFSKIEDFINDLSLPDDAIVMKQWVGKWRSDWFKFTLGELKFNYKLHSDGK